jgi:hypothetical protein
MRRIALLGTLGAIVALSAAPGTQAQLPARQVLVTVDCAHTSIAIRPHEIGVSCDRTFKFYGIHWKRWGRPMAIGVGHARLQGCTPACANGEVTRPRAKLRLTHVMTVAGIWMYARLTYSLIGPLPKEYTRHHGVLHVLPER